MKERIRELAHAENFLPFTILVADGREYRVPTRDHIFAPRIPNAHIIVINDQGVATFLSGLLISAVSVDAHHEQPSV